MSRREMYRSRIEDLDRISLERYMLLLDQLCLICSELTGLSVVAGELDKNAEKKIDEAAQNLRSIVIHSNSSLHRHQAEVQKREAKEND